MSDRKNIAELLQDEEKEGWFERNIVSNAPAIVGIFSNIVVIVADYRAFDVIYNLTGIAWKALAASLACAVPFILWEIAWQYNHTTDNWRKTSLFMAGLAFLTSIVLGIADYIGLDASASDALLAGVVIMTGVHTVVGFLYYYNDPDVARRRRRAQALARAQDQRDNAEAARQLLEDGRTILQVIEQLKGQFPAEDVEAVLQILNGKKAQLATRKNGKQQQPAQQPPRPSVANQPVRAFASDTEDPTKPPSKQ